MHELHFTRDVIEGGDYVLSLALDMIPSRAGLLHLYDIDRREYVVACVSGTGTEALLNHRIAENDPLFDRAMRNRRALVFADARAEETTASSERFVLLGGPVSVIVSPVMKGGRFLGVLELMNPLDGVPFTEEEGNAIDYLSEQLGEFVATRGTQLDPDRITRSVPPTGPAEG
jgi:GAF domain-containing protein